MVNLAVTHVHASINKVEDLTSAKMINHENSSQ